MLEAQVDSRGEIIDPLASEFQGWQQSQSVLGPIVHYSQISMQRHPSGENHASGFCPGPIIWFPSEPLPICIQPAVGLQERWWAGKHHCRPCSANRSLHPRSTLHVGYNVVREEGIRVVLELLVVPSSGGHILANPRNADMHADHHTPAGLDASYMVQRECCPEDTCSRYDVKVDWLNYGA